MATNDYSFVVLKNGKEVYKRDFTEEKFFIEMATFENIVKEKGEQVDLETLKKNVSDIINPIPFVDDMSIEIEYDEDDDNSIEYDEDAPIWLDEDGTVPDPDHPYWN